jgi:molybdate transport repressor ModE-like protein
MGLSLGFSGIPHPSYPADFEASAARSRLHDQGITTEITPAEEPRSDALLLLRGGGRLPVGRDRIAMLQAVAAHGSITAAAKALGFSYKAVWDGLAAINNLLPRPALQTQSGGRGGGGAILTEEGAKKAMERHATGRTL